MFSKIKLNGQSLLTLGVLVSAVSSFDKVHETLANALMSLVD